MQVLVNAVLEFWDREIRKDKEINDIHIGNEELKVSLLANYMIFYIKNSKGSIHTKLWELMNKLRKLNGYKINT